MSYPHYSCISKRIQMVNIMFKAKNKGSVQHLAINFTGLKVYDEGKWKVRKHGTDGKPQV
ncbi:Mobile element protein [Candidatus Enterovibrio altilux]|uniref:Mobile element protein n=1 Tax=Candidatus Enterovibrio altilux TaxID=1927128 RepID=A0A291B7T7_9GAMM|nr:Mobile element protein [Candidatus Enterovibrio luxaltus]